jgi:hypothetical protein
MADTKALTEDEKTKLANSKKGTTDAPKAGEVKKGASKEDEKDPKKLADNLTFVASENLLHGYSSYTYGLSLHALTTSDYSTLVENPKKWKPTVTLISSASRYKSSRNEFFQDDFYFDELKMNTVIGPSAENTCTNAISMDYTIIEPYGMTLLNRLLDLGESTLKIQNYIDIPYVLEINFFGYKDDGVAQTLPLTKYLPITVNTMTMKASTKGTEYKFTATPYSHKAMMLNVQSLPATCEITAKTVADYLDAGEITASTLAQAKKYYDDTRPPKKDATATSDKKTPPKNSQPVNDPPAYTDANGVTYGVTDTSSSTTTATEAPPPVIKTNSLAAGYNAWWKVTSDAGDIEVPDSVAFIIQDSDDASAPSASALAKAKVAIPKKTDAAKTPTASNDKSGTNAQAKANDPNTKQSVAQGDNMNSQVFTVNAGSTLVSVINQVIINSTYITDQLLDAEKDAVKPDSRDSVDNMSKALGDGPVNWFKVVPRLDLKTYDKKRGTFGKKITFYITPYLYYNSKDARAAKAKLPAAVKKYDYIYTGKNKDIIDFNIEFNALYFNTIDINKLAKENTANYKGSNNNDPEPKGKGEKKDLTQNVTPIVVVPKSLSPQIMAGGISKSETVNANSFTDSIYTATGGDMMTLDLRIIGDPDFIKQDDILFGPWVVGRGMAGRIGDGATGSIATDNGQIFCYVNFKTPADIDPAGNPRGQLSYYQTETSSAFSGFFYVQMVESEFRSGKFIQKLTLIRQHNQPGDGKLNKSATGAPTAKARGVYGEQLSDLISGNPAVRGFTDGPTLNLTSMTNKAIGGLTDALPSVPSGLGSLLKDPTQGLSNLASTAVPAGLTNIVNNGATIDTSGLTDQLSPAARSALDAARARFNAGTASGTVFTQA